MQEFFHDHGLAFGEVLAGFFGGLASFFTLPRAELSPYTAISYLTCGALCSGYFTRFAIHYLGIESEIGTGAMSFFIGLLGIYIVKGVLSFGPKVSANPLNFLALFRNETNKKSDQGPAE